MDVTTLVFFALGFLLLTGGADVLVRGSAELAEHLGISRLIVGLTIVAFGTSAPELAVNLQAAFLDKPELALGNVVGSNILNILLVLGVAAIIIPLTVHKRLIKLEIPMMIGVSFFLLFLSFDGMLTRWDGLLLSCGIVLYTIFAVKGAREEKDKDAKSDNSHLLKQIGLILVGLFLLVLGSKWLVDGAIMMAHYFGISELVIGLTIVSIGTSLPELATVIIGSLRGEKDLVIGNVVGSNLFNILLVLGFTSLISPLAVPQTAIYFDMPVMIAVAMLCLPILFSGYIIDRWEGGLFLAYYVAYTLYLFLNATQHVWLSNYTTLMIWFVIPLTILILTISIIWQKPTETK
ncbi:MAG: calcium/sodium antiporter [Thiotrichaceae bacterium]|nr:calcium/sodium antiporter [Thiotrichaceae bacterium]